MAYFGEALDRAVSLILSGDRELFTIVTTSLKISLTAVLIAALPAILLGLMIGLNPFPGKRLLRHLLGTLMAMPTVGIGLLLYGLFSRSGPFGSWGWLYTQKAMVAGQTLLVTPLMIHWISSSAGQLDPRLKPTLMALGANPFQRLLWIVREMWTAIVAALVAAFGRAIGEVGAAMMLGGNIAGWTRTMTTAIALETSKGEFELGLALGIVLLVVAFLVNGIVIWLRGEAL